MSPLTLINLAPTGMIPTRAMTPHVPLSVEEIVSDVRRCAEHGVSIVYSTGRVESPELVKVHERVYVLPDSEVCSPSEATDSVRSAGTQ